MLYNSYLEFSVGKETLGWQWGRIGSKSDNQKSEWCHLLLDRIDKDYQQYRVQAEAFPGSL